MIVSLAKDGTVTLESPENFRGFHVASAIDRVRHADAAGALSAMKMVLDGDQVWVPLAWLEAQGAPFGEPWRADFDGMIAYARKMGWVDDDRGAVRAHVEWPDDV
ncbi:hypothetical protein [Sphingopyxis sp. 550A]